MPNTTVREKFHQDAALWRADGLISPETCEILRKRYAPSYSKTADFMKRLGYAGAMILALALLGLFAAMGRTIGLLISGFLTFLLLSWGIKLSCDVYGRYTHSSKVILFLGSLALLGATGALSHILVFDSQKTILLMGLVNIPVLFFLGYKYKNTFLILLALLILFHWFGSWNMLTGRSSYVFHIQDPRRMAIAALLAIAAGVYHERNLQETTQRLYVAYETVGLIYFNMSLLILSIYPPSTTTLFTAILTLAGILQIIVGSRLKNDLILGFGLTMTALNLFTRYHEFAWEKAEGSLFFIVGGGLMLLSAAAIEFFRTHLQSR